MKSLWIEKRIDEQNTLKPEEVEQLVPIFKLDSNARCSQDEKKLCSFLKGIQFISLKSARGKNANYIIRECASLMKLETVSTGAALYHHKDPSTKVYILLKGKVRRYTQSAIDEVIVPPKAQQKSSKLLHRRANCFALPSSTRHGETNKNKDPKLSPKSSFQEYPQLYRNDTDKSIFSKLLPNGLETRSKLNTGTDSLKSLTANSLTNSPTRPAADRSIKPLGNMKALAATKTLTRLESEVSPINIEATQSIAHEVAELNRHSANSLLLIENGLNSSKIEEAVDTGLIHERDDYSTSTDVLQAASSKVIESQNQGRKAKFDEIKVFEAFSQHQMYFVSGTFRFKHVRTYYPGESFGEMGLIFDSKRIATLIAETPVIALSLDIQNYSKIFDIETSRENVRFIQKFFPMHQNKQTSDFASYFQLDVLWENNLIYEEEEASDGIYLIKEGEIQLSKRLKLEKDLSNPLEKITPRGLTKELKQNVRVINIGSEKYFGEESLSRISKREFTAKVVSKKCSLLKLEERHLMKLERIYPDIVAEIRKVCKSRLSWQNHRLQALRVKAHESAVRNCSTIADQKSSQIIKRIAANKPSPFNQKIYGEGTLQRVSNKNERYRTSGVVTEEQESYYAKLVDSKLRIVHDPYLHQMSSEFEKPVEKADYDTSSLWKASLGEVHNPLVRRTLNKRHDEGSHKATNLSTVQRRKKNYSLINLNKTVSKVMEGRFYNPLDNTSKSGTIGINDSVSRLKTYDIGDGDDDQSKLFSFMGGTRGSLLGDEEIANAFCIKSFHDDADLRTLSPGQSFLMKTPQKRDAEENTNYSFDCHVDPLKNIELPPKRLDLNKSLGRTLDYYSFGLDKHVQSTSNYLQSTEMSPDFEEDSLNLRSMLPQISTKKLISSNHNMFRVKPRNLSKMKIRQRRQYRSGDPVERLYERKL